MDEVIKKEQLTGLEEIADSTLEEVDASGGWGYKYHGKRDGKGYGKAYSRYFGFGKGYRKGYRKGCRKGYGHH